MKLALVLLVALAACQGDKAAGQGSAAPAGDPCATAGDGVRAVWNRQAADAPTEPERQAARELGEKQVARIVRHCRDEHWSADAIACVRAAARSCDDVLTPEQRKSLQGDPARP